MRYSKNNKIYEFKKNYQKDDSLRLSLDLLAGKIFNLSLEDWYQKGFWSEKYMPYSLFYNKKAVASLFAIIFEIKMDNKIKRYIQLSTVMTDTEHRNHGLIKFLIDRVFDDWKMNCDGIYLYANDSVLDFYPRYGFVKEDEYYFTIDIKGKGNTARRLDISKEEDLELLLRLCKTSNPYSKIDMSENYEIVMFHGIKDMRNDIYYMEQEDIIIIFEQNKNTLVCYDIYGTTDKPLYELLSDVANSNCRKAVLLFTLKSKEKSECILHKEENTTLFVLKDGDNIFKHNNIMLPITYHA